MASKVDHFLSRSALGQAIMASVEGCVRFSCGRTLASCLGFGVLPLFFGVNGSSRWLLIGDGKNFWRVQP